MKRGTLAFFAAPPPLLPSFRYACTYRPVFMALYLRQLAAWGFPIEERYRGGSWKRWYGDLLSVGNGEILAWLEN
jgi:formylmethanofuran dehydrogenase subunit C